MEEKPAIDSLLLVEPYSRIDALIPRGMAEYSDSLSSLSNNIISTAIFDSGLPVKAITTVVGHPYQEQLDAEYESLKDINPYKLENLYLPSTMHSYLATLPYRYVMLVYSEGFVWSRNVVFLDEDQLRYESHIYLAVADTRSGKIIYFNRSVPEESNPLNAKLVTKRVGWLLKELKDGK